MIAADLRSASFAAALASVLAFAACAGGDAAAPKGSSVQQNAKSTPPPPLPSAPPSPPSPSVAAPLPPPPPPVDSVAPAAETPTEAPAPLAQALGVKIKQWTWPFSDASADDALDHTMGSLRFEGWLELDGYAAGSYKYTGEVQLDSKPVILVRSKDQAKPFQAEQLGASDLELLADLCRDGFVSVDEGFDDVDSATHTTTLELSAFTIAWRSHHPHELLEDVALLLLAKNLEVRCGLSVVASWEGAATSLPSIFSFDFAPLRRPNVHPGDDYRGTDTFDQFVEAIEASVMLLEVHAFDWKPASERWELVAVPPPPAGAATRTPLPRAVKALNPKSFAPTTAVIAGAKCVYHETASLRALLPDATQTATTSYTQNDALPFTIEGLDHAPAPGVGQLPHCADVSIAPAAAKNGFALTYSCETYKKIWDDGNCAVRASLKNPNDPRNTLTLATTMAPGDAEIKDLRDPLGALSVLAQDAANPLRNASVTLTNFTAGQADAVTRAFDLWLAASLHSYTAYFGSHIVAMEFDADETNGAPCATAGGYANSLIHDKFFWCSGGALSPDFLAPYQSAHSMIYRAMVALHETLHTHGEPHDKDDGAIVSCTTDGGTAYSAVIAHDIFACQEDFCYGLKASAKEELKFELEYSVGNDPRLFDGPCHDWATEMGLTFAF